MRVYTINVDAQGERSFLYWRERGATREMFSLPEMADVLSAASEASLLYLSLISLAVLPPEGRAQLLALATVNKAAGKQVAYDSNYRPNLWVSHAEALAVSEQAIAAATLGLPTNVDEQQLRGHSLTEAAIANLWLEAGCGEVVVKSGSAGCFIASSEFSGHRRPTERIVAVHTSGAGDAFNAGYLVYRLRQFDPVRATEQGEGIARWVISRNGAIPPQDSDAPYTA